eukprot:SAG31_NODE_573_length_13971_cov_5.931949_12_plen_536_part_00
MLLKVRIVPAVHLPQLPSVFPILLLMYPQHLQAITLIQTVMSAVLSVVVSPASACLWNHYIRTADSAKRADVSQRTNNQSYVLSYINLALRYILLIVVIPSWPGSQLPNELVWCGWFVLSWLEAMIELASNRMAAMPTFDSARMALVLDHAQLTGPEAGCSASLKIPSPAEVAAAGSLLGSSGGRKPKAVEIGAAAETWLRAWSPALGGHKAACAALELHRDDMYVLGPSGSAERQVILLKRGATVADQLRACYHAERAAFGYARPTDREWAAFVESAISHGWNMTQALLDPGHHRLLDSDIDAKTLCLRQRRPTADGSAIIEIWAAEKVSGVVALVESRPEDSDHQPISGIKAGLFGALLPQGYPDTVAPEYMRYQLWDTLQVMTNDLRGIIISQASLIGRGVGDSEASPLETLKVDMIVSALANASALAIGSQCDPGSSVSTMKQWRVYNTLLSYFSAAMSLLQGMFPHRRLLFAATNTVVQNTEWPPFSCSELHILSTTRFTVSFGGIALAQWRDSTNWGWSCPGGCAAFVQ